MSGVKSFKKILLTLFLPLLFVQAGCTNSKAGVDIEKEIQKEFGNVFNVTSTYEINDDYVLVEFQAVGGVNNFAVCNLKTGKIDLLSTSGDFATIEKIVDENCIILCDTGKNNYSAIGNFPSIIKFYRDGSNGFVGVREDKYFPLDQSIESGCKDNINLSLVKVSESGIEIYFGPVDDNDVGYYSGGPDIPETKVSYDKQLNQLCFNIKTVNISPDVQKSVKVDNAFISSYDIVLNNNETLFNINLKESVKSYSAKTCLTSYDHPYISIRLSSQ